MPNDTRSLIFITGSLEDTNKYIEVADGNNVIAKQKGQVRIKICDNNGKPFIATLHNVLLEPDLCNTSFSIITLINSGYTCLFHKGFCTVYFVAKDNTAVTLPHSAQSKHAFLGKIVEKSKKKKKARKKIALELLYQILGHRSTRSLLAGDTVNVWGDIELIIYPDPFFTSCQISSMNKKARSKYPLNPKAPSKQVLWLLFQQQYQNI